jgi:hypothetical protein
MRVYSVIVMACESSRIQAHLGSFICLPITFRNPGKGSLGEQLCMLSQVQQAQVHASSVGLGVASFSELTYTLNAEMLLQS